MRNIFKTITVISIAAFAFSETAIACQSVGQGSSISRSCEANVSVYRGHIESPDFSAYIATQNRLEAQAEARRAEAIAATARAEARRAQAHANRAQPNIIINNGGGFNGGGFGGNFLGFGTSGFRSFGSRGFATSGFRSFGSGGFGTRGFNNGGGKRFTGDFITRQNLRINRANRSVHKTKASGSIIGSPRGFGGHSYHK